MSTVEGLTAQILNTIQAHTPPLPHPSPTFVRKLVSSRPTPPPLPSLVATARARILAADLTSCSGAGAAIDARWAARSSFPPGVADPAAKEATLARDVTVQVLDIEDTSTSAWETVQVLEAVEKGEMRRGREVIRLPVAGEQRGDEEEGVGDGYGDGESSATATATATATGVQANNRSKKKATHKLTVQDPGGTKLFALELVRGDPPRIGIGVTQIGEKIVLRAGTVVARGTVLLVPEMCHFLGGKVDGWDKTWATTRLETLRKKLDALKQPVIEID